MTKGSGREHGQIKNAIGWKPTVGHKIKTEGQKVTQAGALKLANRKGGVAWNQDMQKGVTWCASGFQEKSSRPKKQAY